MNLKLGIVLVLISAFVHSLYGASDGSYTTLTRISRSIQDGRTSGIPSNPIQKPSVKNGGDGGVTVEKVGVKSKQLLSKQQLKDLTTTTINRFEAKHLFRNGKVRDDAGNLPDSFKELSSNEGFAKQYLIDLNRKIHNGEILPNGVGQVDKWLKKKKRITIIDEDINKLKADIENKFNVKKVGLLDKDRKLTKESWKTLKNENFITTSAYTVTYLTFEVDPTNPEKIKVKATQMQTKVVLGTDEYGKPSHFESLGPPATRETKNSNYIASFSKDELELNAKTTQELWKNLGLPSDSKQRNTLLNEDLPIFQSESIAADEKLKQNGGGGSDSTKIPDITGVCSAASSRRRSSGRSGGCAISFKPNGDVESIRPDDFLEQYKNAGDKAKQEMAELVKNNRDKVIIPDVDGDAASKNMWNLVELEELKSRVDTMHSVDDIERPKRNNAGGGKGDVGSSFEDLETKMSKIKPNVQLSHSKLSQTLSDIASTKAAKGVAGGLGQVSNVLGGFFLAKTVISGIIHGDATSLAIVGARVGYEVFTESAVAMGSKYFSTVSKAGKATKFLGKAAGPIGAVADIGLSVWSMTKSIQRLNNATNKYERNYAIADIVSDSIDIAVTAAVTGLSMAFPPAAPIFVAVGIVIDLINQLGTAIFKAANEVNRINAEIPLLGFEKRHVFTSRFFDWFGTRKPDYIDSMLDEKRVNDMAVQHNLNFLDKNQDFLGIVFPSRTIYYDGGCTMTKQYCKFKVFGRCGRWEGTETVGRGCDWRKSCSSTWGICDTYKSNHRSGYNQITCTCRGSNTEYGNPRTNSVVDFSRKQNVYWERSVPADVQYAAFQCKPGSLRFIDYKVSQQNSRTDYFCENAIGLLQPYNRRRRGQAMLFDLDDGNDKVTLGTGGSTPNLFRMGNQGQKDYRGDGAINEFLFDSNCTSSLTGQFHGGRGEDGIMIGDYCAKGKAVTVDFRQGRLNSNGRNLDMRFSGIENFNGRERQADTVTVACSTRRVNVRGGISTKFDQVTVPNDPNCLYNLTIFGAPYTKLSVAATKGDIMVPIDSPWTNMHIEFTAPLSKFLKPVVIFTKKSSSQVTNWSFSKIGSDQWRLQFYALSDRIDFVFRPTATVESFPIYFPEKPDGSPNSILVFTGNNDAPWAFYHPLPTLASRASLTRVGCKVIPNIFDIGGNNWFATGGDKDDEFILNATTTNVGRLDGGKGEDTLTFHKDFNIFTSVTLGSDKFRSIENVNGLPGVPLNVRTACDTRTVATQGGPWAIPDVVTIPGDHCINRSMLIVASGHSKVITESRLLRMATDDVVHVVVTRSNENEMRFELETRSTGMDHLLVSMILSNNNWTVTEAKKVVQNKIIVQMEGISLPGKKERVQLTLKTDSKVTVEPYLQYPYIQVSVENSSEIPGTMLIESESGMPKMMYEINDKVDTSQPSKLQGFYSLENIFKLSASKGNWEVTGGSRDDVFIISTPENGTARFQVNGYDGGENTLLIENGGGASQLAFMVNLARSEMGYHTTSASRRGTTKGIQHVIQRVNSPDVIYPTCDTKTINGRGGRSAGTGCDEIIIGNERCSSPFNMFIVVENFTTVKNTASTGKFVYQVEGILTSSLQVIPTKDNVHLFKFLFYPWQYLSAVAFNETTKEMGWKISNGRQERVQAFSLWKKSTSDSEFSNPVFSFYPPGSSVSSDIRISGDGITMATFMVLGNTNPDQVKGLSVDVNRFLINITSVSSNPSGQIHGCSSGSRCSANQFWVFNLASPLELLDGGACSDNGCVNYLHFSQEIRQGKLQVNMDIDQGTVKTETGTDVISTLRNIHELHGTRDITAYVTCNTSQVSGVAQVVITSGACPYELIIGLEEYTTVSFEKEAENLNITQDELFDLLLSSTIHYRFLRPMSFDPEGDFVSIISHSHNYYLPFKLDSLTDLRFDLDDDRLLYNLSGSEFNHSMLAAPGYLGQFYAQPTIITQDGYRIQVARDGSIWTTLGNDASDITPDSVPTLQDTASRLGVTMVINTPTDLYFIGHSSNSQEDRNVLQNVANFTSYLGGGGANDTIYEVVFLEKDVFIYTGFDEDAFRNWSGNDTKQTIDLTDIVVPIRQEVGTKYIPNIRTDGDNLIISMDGYEHNFPGRVVIVDGAFPCRAESTIIAEQCHNGFGPFRSDDLDDHRTAPKQQRKTIPAEFQ